MLDVARIIDYLPTFSFEYNLRNHLQSLHLRVKSAYLSFQDMSNYSLKSHQVPALFVEPYIHNGFRSIHQPWSYYWKSLFHKHNESINVWSHLIGILYMIYLLIYYSKRLNYYENSHSWPFVVSLTTAILMFVCSAFAHLLHSKSQLIHMTCFLIDFIGVSLHGFGSGFIQIYYCSPQWYYNQIQSHYVFILLILGIFACFLNCFAQYYFERPYPSAKRICQFFPCGILWVYSVLPLCIRLYTSNIFLNPSLICHLMQIIIFLIGAVLFGFDIPQRFYPGAFDFFGQGHHLFHLCIYLVTVFQMHGVYWDYEQSYHIINQRKKPDLIFCAGSIFSLIAWDLVIVWCFRRRIQYKYHEH